MKKRRSRVTIDGLDRAPHRAFMRAMGLDDEALTQLLLDRRDGFACQRGNSILVFAV